MFAVDSNSRMGKILPVLFILVLSALLGIAISLSLQANQPKIATLLGLLPVVLILVAIDLANKKGGMWTLICLLLFFWLPLSVGLSQFSQSLFGQLYIFEFGIWFFGFLLVANGIHQEKHLVSARLRYYPFIPFALYILGAIIAFISSPKTGMEIPVLRVTCLLPFILGIVIHLVIKSTNDAGLCLWAIIISGGILAILFIMAQRSGSYLMATDYATDIGLGRASLKFVVPFIGTLQIHPQSAGEKFAFLFTVAFAFWTFQRSLIRRTVAAILCILFGIVIIMAQGRNGGLAVISSTLIITFYSLFLDEKRNRSGSLIRFGIILAFIAGGFWYLASNSSNMIYSQRIISSITDPLADPNFIQRIDLWRAGLKVIMKNPLGVGVFGFSALKSSPSTWDVHNLWLYLLLNYGIPGFVGFIWIMITYLRSFIRGIRNMDIVLRRLSIIGIALIADMLITGLFSPLYRDTFETVILWGPMTIIFAALNFGRSKTSSLFRRSL